MRLRREPAVTQLGRLASSGRTGVMRLTGQGGGEVHLREGDVVYAESAGTPGVASRFARWPGPSGERMPGPIERGWVVREAIADAAADLLSGEPRYGRFRDAAVTAPGGADGMPVAELLAEVARRHRLAEQMSAVVTADTAVARDPRLHAPGVHVSAAQWALLTRMDEPVTPRMLAMVLGQSVFTVTIEVFRLIRLNLVSTAGRPGDEYPGEFPGHQNATISFIRAVAR